MVGETPTHGSGFGTKNPDHYDFDNFIFLHPSDNDVVYIISFKLYGTENYRIWKSSITRDLKGRNKLGLADKTFPKPITNETKIHK